jgi:hypothetical protein
MKLLLLAFLVVGCGAPATSTPNVVDEVTGWTRSANFTSCAQWLDEMTPGQRTVMARDLLPLMRSTVDTAADDGATLAPAFADAISETCRRPDLKSDPEYVVTAAASLAFLDDARFQP